MADRTSLDVDQHFAGPGFLEFDFFDLEGSAELAADSGLDHGKPILWGRVLQIGELSYRKAQLEATNAAGFGLNRQPAHAQGAFTLAGS